MDRVQGKKPDLSVAGNDSKIIENHFVNRFYKNTFHCKIPFKSIKEEKTHLKRKKEASIEILFE